MTADVEVWHYASPRPSVGPYCWPICWDRQPTGGPKQGQTLLRQDVTCPKCLQMNTTYLREYRANPTEGNLLALKQTVWELEARGAM